MPTDKRVLVQLSRRHTWKLKRQYNNSIAPERYVPGGGEQLPLARLGCGLHRYLVLVQQRAPPTLICAMDTGMVWYGMVW